MKYSLSKHVNLSWKLNMFLSLLIKGRCAIHFHSTKFIFSKYQTGWIMGVCHSYFSMNIKTDKLKAILKFFSTKTNVYFRNWSQHALIWKIWSGFLFWLTAILLNVEIWIIHYHPKFCLNKFFPPAKSMEMQKSNQIFHSLHGYTSNYSELNQ